MIPAPSLRQSKPSRWPRVGGEWFPGGSGHLRSRDVFGTGGKQPIPQHLGPPSRGGGYFWAEKRKMVQLPKLAANPMTIINNFPAKVPGYFLSVLAERGRFILFAAWNSFPFLSFFFFYVPCGDLKPANAPDWGCCSPPGPWRCQCQPWHLEQSFWGQIQSPPLTDP